MKSIILIPILLISMNTFAVSWKDGIGEYRAVLPEGFDGGIIIDANGDSGVFVSAFGNDWAPWSKGKRFPFLCNGGKCKDKTGSGILNFIPGNIVSLDTGTTALRFRKIDGNNNPPSSPESTWMNKEYADTNQVIYSAYQTDKASSATLVISCKPKSAQVSWAIRLNEKTHLAAQGAVLYAKATLKVDCKLDSGQTQKSNWSVADNRYITPTQIPPSSIAELKKGSQLSMTLVAIKPDGTEVKLEAMNFSLRGSTAALNKLQESCGPNSNSDLPTPLP
ncbi:hypothetical protein ACLSU7_17015 [Bdellovibrio sp. HCB185ZH]|uniref:hypothetical protein n=1 Tax=Bdellovibrio sp. HCB185ZH TaxID=3394235 RepID=UPI0039A76E4D